MKKISFIITAFNKPEQVIKRCLDEIVKIELSDIEILFINDGSQESYTNIYKQLIVHYPSIQYFEKENGGVSSARNYGIKKATGKYVYFIDADDTINSQIFNSKLEKYDQDLIIFDVQMRTKKSSSIFKLNNESGMVKSKKILPQAVKNGLLNWAIGKLYLRDYLLNNNIFFDITKMSGEDFDFVIRVLESNPSIEYVKHVSYIYYYQEDTNIERIKLNPYKALSNSVVLFNRRLDLNRKCKGNMDSYIKLDFINTIFEIYGLSLIYKFKDSDLIYKNILNYLEKYNLKSNKNMGKKVSFKLLSLEKNSRLQIKGYICLRLFISKFKNKKYR